MTLYKHELKMNRMSFVIWLVGVLAMSAGCIFLFPLIDESMADMSEAFASMGGFSAAFGMDKLPITTLEGFFGTEIGTIFALGGGMFASLIGISALSKEESSHTAEFLHTLTLSRRGIVTGKLLSILTLIAAFDIAAFGVFCLIGAVTMIASDSFNVMADGVAMIENLPGIEPGPLFIQSAFAVVFGNLGAILLAICICFFCFTSIVAMHYYAEVNACYLFKNHTKGATLAARIISVIAIFLGGLTYSDLAWSVGDLGLGLMAFVNFPVILILGKYAFAALRDYEEQEKAGVKRFTFDPAKLGIRGADEQMWAELSARAKNQEQI